MKKYKLTDEVNERGLYRIVALRDIPRHRVKAGDLGGFVESEENLSQDGDAWVSGNACIFDAAYISGNAYVSGNARVYGDVWVFNNAQISENAWISNNVLISGNARVYENARVCKNAQVSGNAHVFGNAQVFGDVYISGNAHVFGDVYISGNACVSRNACVFGSAWICGDARIYSGEDYLVFKNWWGCGHYFTWTRSNNMWKAADFYGTGEELIAKAKKDSKLSGREYKKVVDYVESILENEKKILKKKTICRDSKGRFCKSR